MDAVLNFQHQLNLFVAPLVFVYFPFRKIGCLNKSIHIKIFKRILTIAAILSLISSYISSILPYMLYVS
jgi:hypothetical protein